MAVCHAYEFLSPNHVCPIQCLYIVTAEKKTAKPLKCSLRSHFRHSQQHADIPLTPTKGVKRISQSPGFGFAGRFEVMWAGSVNYAAIYGKGFTAYAKVAPLP